MLACARRRMDAAHVAQTQELAGAQLDWAYFLRVVVRNYVAPLVSWQWSQFPSGAPSAVRDCLAQYSLKAKEKNESHLEEFARLQELLAREGIGTLAGKEIVLTAGLYGLERRLMEYLDVYLEPEDVPAAWRVLQAEHYRPEVDLAEGQRRSLLRGRSSLLFVRQDWETGMRLHWSLEPKPHSPATILSALRPHARAVQLPQPVAALGPEDLVRAVVFEVAENLWGTLQWVCDLAEVCEENADLNWDALREEARRCGWQRILHVGLLLAAELRGLHLPEGLRGEVDYDGEASGLVAEAADRIFSPGGKPVRTANRLAFHWRARERWRDRARYAVHFLTTPTAADWEKVRLAARLSRLYAVLRPARLVAEAAGRAARRLLGPPASVSQFAPSTPSIMARMLQLAEVGPGDVVFDLGCGDGRIVIEAAKRGAHGVGIDIDAQLVGEARKRARAAGVGDRVEFRVGDLRTADLGGATVVVLYLPAPANLALRAHLLGQLRPGARIVSRGADIGGWDAVEVCTEAGYPDLLYVKRITDAAGAEKEAAATAGGK